MEKNNPIVAINLNDLNALSQILTFYKQHLVQTLPPSAKKGKRVSEVQFVLVKVALLGSEKVAAFTYDDIFCIETALGMFVIHVRKHIPPSQSRDDVIESCEQLRHHFATSFPSLVL